VIMTSLRRLLPRTLSLIALALCLAACGGGSQPSSQSTPTPSLWLGPGAVFTVQGDQQATLVQSRADGGSVNMVSNLQVSLRLEVQSVDRDGNAHIKVTPQQVTGTNAGGISVDVGSQPPYDLVLGPDLQIVAGRLWPDWGSAAEVQGADAFSALRKGSALPKSGSWQRQLRRSYLTDSGAITGQATSKASSYDGGSGIVTLQTSMLTPVDYGNHAMLMHSTGKVDHEIESTFRYEVGSVKKTTDNVSFSLDYTMTTGQTGHQEGVITTTLTFS
jgi:hypothetical protein